ncbi:MAG: peptide chain release factor 2 [Dissulfurimicrobium sp.]|uniref:peptide chain release factor 2 n=1 Tax=Dissulfurimicrobium TaxID=1769732 RepID=UPI001EDB2D58|nr:peptide chain release factor 2 [Dissulfurimicrobium hydrothermale]UKL14639.1 peptide chain release factor 2 [Dissulfurimicrobium hydrothermale]
MLEKIKRYLQETGCGLEHLRGYFDEEEINERLSQIEHEMLSPGFWDDPASKELLRERSALASQKELIKRLSTTHEELVLLFEMAEDEGDDEALKEVFKGLESLKEEIERAEISRLLSGPHDNLNAIVTIHAGAGGTEAQDWAEMLLRMYLRWAERRGFSVKLLDLMPGDEAGIKGATFLAEGAYAYGYLKSEAGIHRLVRISPFDASGRRHTSFASVFVAPELDESIEIEINEKDLRIDTYRASGAGGQHVNKTSSAVRITHIPTGIVVQCQNERSQHKNKAIAMKILMGRLYELERSKKEAEKQKIHGDKKEIAWGSQIRSYTLQPYQLVKDHRTELEIGNVGAVLDGDIDPFINAYLKQNAA